MLDAENPGEMNIPTEPIGSIPRPLRLIEAFQEMPNLLAFGHIDMA